MSATYCPIHRKTHFFKYTTCETALLVLRNGKVRYSSPLLFNDPFDVQTELRFDFDITTLPQLVQKEIEDIVFSRNDIVLNDTDEESWGKAVLLLKEKVTSHGYYATELKDIINMLLKYLTVETEKTRLGFNNGWHDFLPKLRVFSVSETNESMLMWSHYADYHRGVVFKLKVLPELDTPLCMAGRVIYKPIPPVFFTSKQWIEYIIGITTIDYKRLHWDYAYIKSDIWVYEKEWRVWDLLTEATPELYSDYELHPQELEAIYFGCKADDETKNIIREAAEAFNPNTDFYVAEKSINEYGLIFKKI